MFRSAKQLNEVTFLIKTFEREYCVKKLVKSIYRYYPNAIIRIGDDSETSCKAYMERKYGNKDLKVYELPRDCGISYGRNYLLDRVETEYFILLDDDFEFDKLTDVGATLDVLKEKDMDIVAGYLRDYGNIVNVFDKLKMKVKTLINRKTDYNYLGNITWEPTEHTLRVDYRTHDFPEFVTSDIVLNFFVGKTKVIREENRWDDELKLHEHTAFFFCAKQKGLKVGFTNKMSVRHEPLKSKKYLPYRNRGFFQLFMLKHEIYKRYTTMNGGKEKYSEVSQEAIEKYAEYKRLEEKL